MQNWYLSNKVRETESWGLKLYIMYTLDQDIHQMFTFWKKFKNKLLVFLESCFFF